MAARPKLTPGRQRRLFAILGLGEGLEAACRAVQVSATAVRKRAAGDPVFAARLRAAREVRPEPDPGDWIASALWLESETEHWSVPGLE